VPPDGVGDKVHVKPRVLLVDDSDEHRGLYAAMLRSTATVSTAARGEHALSLACADPPDVIVLDVMMPGMDGWETCERLKADSTTAGIPIVMLTSLDDVDVPARARQAGAIAVLRVTRPTQSVPSFGTALTDSPKLSVVPAPSWTEVPIVRPIDPKTVMLGRRS
jgi:CheY-like chemotaxis protein